MRASLAFRCTSLLLLTLLASAGLSLSAASAGAQSLSATLGESSGASLNLTIENTYDFAVKAVNVRLSFENVDGSQTFYFSAPGWVEDLDAGESWTGNLTFQAADGTAPPEDMDWGNYDRISVAGGVNLDELQSRVDEAAGSSDMETIAAALAYTRERVPPVSRSARFHGDQVAGSGLPVGSWFDLERIDGFVEQLEEAACAEASEQFLGTRRSARSDMYAELGGVLRELNLHITCMSTEAKLAAAAALMANERAQDALVLVEKEEGTPTEAWRDIYIAGNIALARTAAELNVTAFSSIRPALQALNDVHALDPDNRELQQVANVLIPNAAQWLITATAPMTRDLANAETALQMLRPTWSRFEQIETAASRFASALIDEGLEQCRQGNFINSRNRFDRGERILEGVEEWESRAEEINRCRALGALQEGREIAGNVNDDDAPERGFAKLDEAQARYELPQADIDAFKTDIAGAWINIALRQINDEQDFDGAMHSLGEAEEVSPGGMSDPIREAWLRYAEALHEQYGMLMTGEQVEDARAALERAEGLDPDRIAAMSSKLTVAFYGYRVGIPGLFVLLALIAVVVTVASKRKAARYQAELDEL